jgi:pimeloyl-ACP methyl ester carboxylesterase
MSTATSADGTTIAYERTGSGPAVVLVDGALSYRAAGPSGPLARELATDFTVYTYDRRGRCESGDTTPYAVQREVEDLAAVLEAAGGSPYVYGISSGAALALEAANRGVPMAGLAAYEAPFVVDATRPPVPADFLEQLRALLASGRRGDVVKLFMTQGVRVPAPFVALMQLMPAWSKLKGVAHTVPYDVEIMADGQRGRPLPADRWPDVKTPTLVIGGSKSPAWLANAARNVADVVPGAEHRVLAGQTHLVKPEALAPVLRDFFSR